MIVMPWISTVQGVDFSGAAEAGKTAWIAQLDVTGGSPGLRLADLKPLGRLAGTDSRDGVYTYLVDRILNSGQTLWGMDFPFGLPVELELGSWDDQLENVVDFEGDAKQYGRSLVQRTQERVGKMHARRLTDRETKTPFDCYHYRIIYQTFHGMRDVLSPAVRDPRTAVLPFQYGRCSEADRIVVEACPSSTLKRMGLPHQKYKQAGKRKTDYAHRKVRREILDGLSSLVALSDYRRRILMSDPGGDALDAVIAGIGSWYSLGTEDHNKIALSDRYPREGYVYA